LLLGAGLATQPTTEASSIFTVELEFDITFRGLRSDENATE